MDNNIKVAVRIRPQQPKERIDMCDVCTKVCPDAPQIFIGKEKAFTFDHVFDTDSFQEDIYAQTVETLVEGCFEGYNATVLAYGQTGSGKTYTMGTGLELVANSQTKGIIPRAVEHLFQGISSRQTEARNRGQPTPDFAITSQFLELYNEEVIDLLCQENRQDIKIREDKSGNMYVVGASTHQVHSVEETSQKLKMGAISRTTGSTQMNSQSSRSHAIFTLHIKQTRVVPVDEGTSGEQEFETLTSKFHFVDLAGSERLKRTGATGDRQKEGIAINSGLLVLGNVISALGDKTKKSSHVPYRDSKLTRFLQDSLGGNSRTLMIACVSPSDRDFVETLNTLRYANRAKNITNKVVVNQDKSSQVISVLRRQIAQLEVELLEFKQGKRVVSEDGSEAVNDMFHENTMLQQEMNRLKMRVKVLEEQNQALNQRLIALKTEKDSATWASSDHGPNGISDLVQKYVEEIEELRFKFIESEETACELRRQVSRLKSSPGKTGFLSSPYSAVAISGHYDVNGFGREDDMDPNQIIKLAKKDVKKMKKLEKVAKVLKFNGEQSDPNGNDVVNENGTNTATTSDDTTSPESFSDDEVEDDEEDDDADTASTTQTQLELYNLTNEITSKERLILELEKSQKKLLMLKKHYEEKLTQLQAQISETEADRDRALAKLSSSSGSAAENKRKKVEEDYQVKLNSLQNQLKQYQAAKKEHDKSMRASTQRELEIRQLRNQVEDLKKAKVRCMAVMKEEQQKRREEGAKYNKKIAQLSKQERIKDVKIRSLESEKKKCEAMLRRKDEEVKTLKNRVKPMSDQVAGRVGSLRNIPVSSRNGTVKNSSNQTTKVSPFSGRAAKLRWGRMEKHINAVVVSKTSLAQHEAQMDRYIEERRHVIDCINKNEKRLAQYKKERRPEHVIKELTQEIDDLESKLSYIKNNIDDCRDTIVQLEQNVHEADDIVPLVSSVSHPQEMQFIISKCLDMVISQSLLAASKDAEKQETDVVLQEMNQSRMIQEEVLHQVLETSHHLLDASPRNKNGHEPHTSQWNTNSARQNRFSPQVVRKNSNPSSQFKQPAIPSYPADDEFNGYLPSSPTKRDRRKFTQTSMELQNDLSNPFNCTFIGDKYLTGKMSDNKGDMEKSFMVVDKQEDPMTKSLMSPAILSSELHRVPSAPSLKDLADTTPPASPSLSRKNREENVFSRLTSGTTTSSVVQPDSGLIAPFTGKAQYDKGSLLICTHIAEGHSRAVLSVSATNDVLFTGSKDCTVKVWDLHTGREIQSLVDHPDSVTIVRYNEYNRLAFSVSKSFIKVWDPRENPARCVKTLSSSGLAHSGSAPSSVNVNGMTTNELPQGETRIFDIRLSPYGSTLFSTSGHTVRFWDLRMFFCIGKLNTGHQSNITCMAVEESGVDNNLVVTGSKDHYIKLFEVMEGTGGIHNPRSTLTPPHYDGIESLCIHSDSLFSASRDACIKKWDLTTQRLVQSLNGAHRDWIQSLAVLPNSNTLISGCRQGFLKLWSTDTCSLLGDIKAHTQAINCIDTNAMLVFTASGDNTIGIWTKRNNDSPDASD